MLKFLLKPYPFNNDLIHNAKVVFFISIVLGLFLFFFEPFNFNSFGTQQKLIVSSVISLITFAVLSFDMIVLPAYLKNIFESHKWTILKEFFWNFWLFISVTIGYFIYYIFNPYFEISPKDVATIFLISTFAIFILVILNQNRLVKLNLNAAIELNKKLISKNNSNNDLVLFESEYKKDTISLQVSSLRLLKSSGNYVEIYYEEKDIIKKHMIRNRLKNIEQQLVDYDYIYKCHRTYLVNTRNIKKALGDPQGVKIIVDGINFPIPVSKIYVNKLKEVL